MATASLSLFPDMDTLPAPLSFVTTPAPRAIAAPPRRIPRYKAPTASSVVDQTRTAFHPSRRLAAVLGFILGGFVPVATFTVTHCEVATHPALWLLVLGGLAYSSLSVYAWARQAFNAATKAAGFVLLLEGTMTFSGLLWLSACALLVLVTINGICAACALQRRG